MSFCLIPKFVSKFTSKLKDGTINPDALTNMSSAERNAMFSGIVGKENARKVNSLLESKILIDRNTRAAWELKNLGKPLSGDQEALLNKFSQQKMQTWAKTVLGVNEKSSRAVVDKASKLQNGSDLIDLVNTKLGINVGDDEIQKIMKYSKNVTESRAKIPDSSPIGSAERMDYGLKQVIFNDFMGKTKIEKLSLKQILLRPSLWL